MTHYDSIIIGFGKGGKTLAGALASRGETVALVERSSQMYGGTCINVGCIPSKSLVRGAAQARLNPGASFEEKSSFYAAAIAEKRRVTGLLRGKNYDKLAGLEKVTILDGTAGFVSPTQVRVEGAQGSQVIEGGKIFINTGARPFVPPIPGLQGNPRVFISETLMDLDVLPRRLVIIGGGYISLEFASMYASYGSEVTILQDTQDFLPREDRDMAEAIRQVQESQGIRLEAGVAVDAIKDCGSHACVTYTQNGAQHTAEGEAVLVATGRRPNLQDLHPEAAGVELTPRGAVKVDDHLRTTAPNIWAMGDVTGGLQFTYVSLDDYRIVLSDLSGGSRTLSDRRNVPYSVFMAPAFSRVGLSETEARQAGLNIKVAKLPAAAIPKAQVLRSTQGLLKAVVDADSGRILGAMLLCEESYEIINVVKLAMDAGLPYTALRDNIYTHPTMCEALNDLFAI